MNFAEALASISEFLKTHKRATNSALLNIIGNRADFLEKIKENLIFKDLA